MRRLFVLLLLGWLSAAATAEPFRFTLLHTNDLHSHFEGSGPDALFTPQAGDGDPVLGHYARLLTLIRAIRHERQAAGEAVLTVDAGDSFSGSLFAALAPAPNVPLSPELEFFQLAGYDAMTPGNHEFDAGEAGYANALDKARPLGILGSLVAGNLVASDTAPPALRSLPRMLVRELRAGQRTLRIGVLGFMGPSAAQDCATLRRTVHFAGFDDATGQGHLDALIALAEAQAAELRRRERVDLVILLLHGGDPEDAALAKARGIDLVVAGHTHDLYATPRRAGDKLIVQAGSYGRNLGRLDLEFEAGQLHLRNPGRTILRVDDSVAADAEMLSRIAAYKAALDERIAPLGHRYASPVTRAERDMPQGLEANNPLGVFVTSRIEGELKRRLTEPPDVYFTELSLIREDWLTVRGRPTPLQMSDIFRLLPVGFGPGFSPGSPIVGFHVTAKELSSLMEVIELQRLLGRRGALVYSDTLSYRVRGWGIPFVNRIADLKLHGKALSQAPPLIHVATTAYVAAFIPRLGQLTHGLASVQMKDRQGRPIGEPQVLAVPPEAFLFADSFNPR